MKNLAIVLILTLFTCGCTVGPNYKRPAVDVPGTYRGAAQEEAAQPQPSASQSASPPAENAPQQGAQAPDAAQKQTAPPANAEQKQTAPPAEQSIGDQKWWEVFQDPQIAARNLVVEFPPENGERVRAAASPIRFSRNAISYELPPPELGEHTEEVLSRILRKSSSSIRALRETGVI